MQTPERSSRLSLAYVGLLMLLTAATFALAKIQPNDDHFLYQKFIEALAAGRFDLTIPGFHGTDVFGFVAYLFTRSPVAQIHGLMAAAIALPLMAFLAGRALFRRTESGLILATIVAMMPFVSFVCLRGWTGPGYWFWMLMTIWLAARRSRLTGLPWAMAILTKPFAAILLPLILILAEERPAKGFWERFLLWRHKAAAPGHRAAWIAVLTAGTIVGAYALLQYLQAGRVFAGAHADVTAETLTQSPLRIALNLAHSLQILFSVHNYYFPNPALTGAGNLLHTSPILIFLGLFGILAPKAYWNNLHAPVALGLGAVLGIAMNAVLDHMDHFYMEASVLLLILAAIPVLRHHRTWIALALATLHFQWLYFYLEFKGNFALTPLFFVMPAAIDVCFLLFSLRRAQNA